MRHHRIPDLGRSAKMRRLCDALDRAVYGCAQVVRFKLDGCESDSLRRQIGRTTVARRCIGRG